MEEILSQLGFAFRELVQHSDTSEGEKRWSCRLGFRYFKRKQEKFARGQTFWGNSAIDVLQKAKAFIEELDKKENEIVY